MTEIFHICNHALGICGESHPSMISFVLGHNEAMVVSHYIRFIKMKFDKYYVARK